MEEESLAWHSALESIEVSLGLGDIQDCFHRYVLNDEFASYFEVDTVLASELSGSYLEGSLLDWHSGGGPLEVLPFHGFSWSLYFVQTTNENIVTRSLEPTGSRIMNDRASPATFAAGNRQEGATLQPFCFC